MGKIYIDARGWRYKVMQGLGTEYKARYCKPGKSGYHCMARMPWRATAAEAQADLDALAARKGWKEAGGDE